MRQHPALLGGTFGSTLVFPRGSRLSSQPLELRAFLFLPCDEPLPAKHEAHRHAQGHHDVPVDLSVEHRAFPLVGAKFFVTQSLSLPPLARRVRVPLRPVEYYGALTRVASARGTGAGGFRGARTRDVRVPFVVA